MAFSAVFQYRLDDPAGKGRFLIEHAIEHQQFTEALAGQTPPFIAVSYPIQRMEDPERWLDVHQKMSQSVWTGLGGGASTDFGTLDWQSPSQVEDWFRLHLLWHQQVRGALGI